MRSTVSTIRADREAGEGSAYQPQSRVYGEANPAQPAIVTRAGKLYPPAIQRSAAKNINEIRLDFTQDLGV